MTENRDGDTLSDAVHGVMNLQGTRKKPTMFKILELKGVGSAPATDGNRSRKLHA